MKKDLSTEKNAVPDENFFAHLYIKYKRYVFSYLKKKIGSEQIAEEITQDIFLYIYETKKIFSRCDPRSEKSYLMKIAKSRATDYIRRKKREELRYRNIYLEEVELNRQFFDDIENAYIDGEVLATLFDTLNDLKAEEREVLLDKYKNHLADIHVAEKAKISNYTLKKIEKKFSELVREKLLKYFA